MKKYSILFFLIFTTALFAQEETQIPFDKKSNLMEITSKSPFDSLGKSFHPDFQKILLFKSGESFVLEIYLNVDGKLQRKRQVLSNDKYLKLVEQVEKSSAIQQKFGKAENREDLRWDFVIDQTLFAQYHSGAWQGALNIDAPIFLLVSGSSYFVVDNIASRLELNRFNVLNMRQAHINGLTQGFILGTMLSDIQSLTKVESITPTDEYGNEEFGSPPWLRITLLLSSGLGIYNTYDTYNDTKTETNPGLYTLTKSIELYSLSTLPLLAGTILPKKTLESLDNATFWSTLSLAPSLTAKYWVPKYFSDYSLTLGDAMIAENIMINTFATGGLSLMIIQSDSRSVNFGILTASQIAGLYFGTNYANGKNFTYKDSRHVSTFAIAGALAGEGLFLVLFSNSTGDPNTGIKLMSALTIAGLWSGFAYGINTLENENTSYLFPENFQLSIHPELLVASNSLNQISRKPIHIPIIQVNYNW